MAVGHSLLVVIYHVLKHGVEYRDLGPDYFDRLEPERLRRYLVKRLQGLGYDVTLTPRSPDASAAKCDQPVKSPSVPRSARTARQGPPTPRDFRNRAWEPGG